MPSIHRHSDPRKCGASTIAAGQGTVFANGLLVSVNGDPNTHGGGNLYASCNEVYCEGILTVNHSPDSAAPDALCIPIGGAHCAPATAGGSPDVYVGD
jgi:hypothetical protein